MCTVTYLPKPQSGFILTSSRDEQPGRKTSAVPQQVQTRGHTLLFPRDEQAGGTWVATAQQATLCLLNGAFLPHIPNPPYRHSRGLVILHYFDYPSTEAFIKHYPFSGLEPFTLIVQSGDQLWELRWDGKQLFKQEMDPEKPYLWASATLYGAEIVEKRKRWFEEWLQQNADYQVEAIRTFHKLAGEGDPQNDLFMRRTEVQTVSLTSIIQQTSSVEMWYEAFNEATVSGVIKRVLPFLQTSLSS